MDCGNTLTCSLSTQVVDELVDDLAIGGKVLSGTSVCLVADWMFVISDCTQRAYAIHELKTIDEF